MGLIGTTVGRIRVLETLGTGGMGEVYVGFDEKLERKVALKALRQEFRLDEESKRRFLREARALSQLRHPSICLIHDYLETEASDFLVLELIEGEPLSQALDRGIPERQKLDISQQLAAVLVAAHGQGIIHRDLKPGNVMLTPGDQVKVLDFGLARSLHDATAPTVLDDTIGHLHSRSEDGAKPAEEGSRVVGTDDETLVAGGTYEHTSYVKTLRGVVLGTLAYMSPEQARGEPATPASDMYSLGLVLQELFTGKPAYEPSASRAEQIEKASRGEVRSVEGLDADVGALITRLTAPQPGARPSAQDTADRLAWIKEEPARQLASQRRRLKNQLTAAAFVFLVATIGVVSYQAIRISREVERANRQAAIAEAVNRFLNEDLLSAVSPEDRGRDVLVREVLDAAAAKLESEAATGERFADQPLVEAAVRTTVGGTYYRLGLYDQALPHLEQALEIHRSILGESHVDTLTSMVWMSLLEGARGQNGRAIELLEAVVDTTGKEFGADNERTLEAKNNLAAAYYEDGRFEEAISLLVPVVAANRTRRGPDDPQTLSSINNLASNYLALERFEDALPLFREVLEMRRRALGADHPGTLLSMSNLASFYKRTGDLPQAETLFVEALKRQRAVLGSEHPQTLTTMNNLGSLYVDMGDPDDAEELLTEALAAHRRVFGEEDLRTLMCMRHLARAYKERGDLIAAEELTARVLAAAQASLPTGHWRLGMFAGEHGDSLSRLGRFAEAEELLLQSHEVLLAARGEGDPVTRHQIQRLVELYERWQLPAKAEQWRARLGAP